MRECIAVPVGQPPGSPCKSQVVKAKGLLFFPAQRGVAPAANTVQFPDAASQARQVLENMKAALESLGGSLDDVVKTGMFLKDMGDRPAINEVWSEYFGHESPPTRFAVQMADLAGPNDPTRIVVDAVALAPGGTASKECLHTPLPPRFGPFISQAVKAEGFLFFAAQRGVDAVTNRVQFPDAASQVRQVLENMKAVLESLGGSLDDVVKTGLFLKDMGDRPAINEVWSEYFGHESPPTRFAVQVVDIFGPDDPTRILVDAIALEPGGTARKECLHVPLPPRFGPFVSQAVKANGLLFFAAQRGVDAVTNRVQSPDTASQAQQVLENMKAVLESLGGSLDDVVKTGLYLKNFEDHPAVNEQWTKYFGETPPSRFAVQVADIFGGTDLTNILVDAIAIAPGAQTSASP